MQGVTTRGRQAAATGGAPARRGTWRPRPTRLVGLTGALALAGLAAGCDTGPSAWESQLVVPAEFRPADEEGRLFLAQDESVLVFASGSALEPGDTNGQADVFARDMASGTTTLVSVDASGAPIDGRSSLLGTSADGTKVLFRTDAAGVVTGDANGAPDVFVRDLAAGTTTAVSVTATGATGDAGAITGAISADGTAVAFVSGSIDITPGIPVPTDPRDPRQVNAYVRNLATGVTSLVSATPAVTGSGGVELGSNGEAQLAVGPGGAAVAFVSVSNDLGPVDTNAARDVYLRDVAAGTTTLVSADEAGTDAADGPSLWPLISADGSTVVFESPASDLTAGDVAGWDVYAYDVAAGEASRVSVPGPTDFNEASFDPALSPDGSKVAFTSTVDEAGVDDNGDYDVYVRDLGTGELTLASANAAGTSGGNSWSQHAVFDGSGTRVAFTSLASDLGPRDADNSGQDLYLRDLAAGVTSLVSSGADESADFETTDVLWAQVGPGGQAAYLRRTPGTEETLLVSTLHGADLSAALAATPSPAPAGGQATVTLTATNGGPEAAEGVSAGVVVPAGATVAAVDGPGTCSTEPAGGGTLASCAVGDLAAGADAVVTVTIDVDAPAGSTLGLTGALTSPTVDALPGGRTATAQLAVG